MEYHKLPRSLALPTNANKLPQNGLLISFATGAFAGTDYCVSRTNCVWPLVGAAMDLGQTALLTVKLDETGVELLLYCDAGKCITFLNTGQNALEIFGFSKSTSMHNACFGVYDPRWNIAYFLPKLGFISFAETIEMVTAIIQNGILKPRTTFVQSGESVMEEYRKMEDLGIFE